MIKVDNGLNLTFFWAVPCQIHKVAHTIQNYEIIIHQHFFHNNFYDNYLTISLSQVRLPVEEIIVHPEFNIVNLHIRWTFLTAREM